MSVWYSALARAIREELEAYFTEDYAVLAAIVAEARRELGRGAHGLTAGAWQRALDADLRRLIAEGRRGVAGAERVPGAWGQDLAGAVGGAGESLYSAF